MFAVELRARLVQHCPSIEVRACICEKNTREYTISIYRWLEGLGTLNPQIRLRGLRPPFRSLFNGHWERFDANLNLLEPCWP